MCCNGFRIILMFTLAVLSFGLNAFTPSIPVILWFFVVINTFTLLLFGIDKYYASKERQRVSELTFYFFSVAGGFLGILLGMALFRHKYHKKEFFIIEMTITVFWLFALWFIINNFEKIQRFLQHLVG